MATSRKFARGRHLTIAKASIDAGDMVAEGSITGVALTDTDAAGNVTIDTEGVYNLDVKGHDGSANAAVSVGDKVYLTDGEAFLDVDDTATLFGYALGAVASGDTTNVPVKLIQA